MEDTKSDLLTNDPLSLNGALHDIQGMQGMQDIQATPHRIPAVLLDEHKQNGLESSKSPAIVAKKKGVPSSKDLVGRKMSTLLRERCRQICLSIFFRNQTKIQSLGITSSIVGEGKTFIAMMIANVLAKDIDKPITLLECNWEHPSFHTNFDIQPTPGLAEWLRGECDLGDICHHVRPNLTVMPAGYGGTDAVKLLQRMQKENVTDTFLHSDGILIVDLPPVVTTAYGPLAASLVDSLILVVHAGVTTELLASEAYSQLEGLPIYGAVFNQVESRIPRWIRQLF